MRRTLGTIVLALSLAASAHADPKADALAKMGKKLLAEKKYAEACAAYEEANQLGATVASKSAVAHCYEDWGKLATALKWYRDAEAQAVETKDKGLAKLKEHAQAIDDDTPRLTLRVGKDVDEEAGNVTLDGAPVKLGEPIAVDPGPHVVEFTTDAGDRKKKTVPMERGGSSDVKLDLPKRKPNKLIDHREHHDEHVPPGSGVAGVDPGKQQRLASYILGGVGVAAMVTAGYLTIDAHGSYKDALSADCNGKANDCNSTGLSITHKARTQANIATVVGTLGALTVGGAVALYVLAPHRHPMGEHHVTIAPTTDGFVVFGTF